MSDILIRGMEMPTGNDELRLIIHSNGQVIIDKKTYWEEAEAVHVPPHGRRVVYRGDVYNAIEAKRIKTLDRVLNDRYIEGMHDGLKQALFALATVEDAPTIIQAEEGE